MSREGTCLLPRINHFLKHLSDRTLILPSWNRTSRRNCRNVCKIRNIVIFLRKHWEAYANPSNRSFMPTSTLIPLYCVKYSKYARSEDLLSSLRSLFRRCNVTLTVTVLLQWRNTERESEITLAEKQSRPLHLWSAAAWVLGRHLYFGSLVTRVSPGAWGQVSWTQSSCNSSLTPLLAAGERGVEGGHVREDSIAHTNKELPGTGARSSRTGG